MRTAQQGGFEWNRRRVGGGAGSSFHGLVEFFGRGFGRGGFLLRFLFDAIGAAAAGGDVAIGDQLLTFVKSDAAAHPIDVIAHAVRDESGARQGEPDDASVIVIEAGIVRGDDGIMLGDPFEFSSVFNAAGHDRVGIHRARGLHLRNDLIEFGLAIGNQRRAGESEGLLVAK